MTTNEASAPESAELFSKRIFIELHQLIISHEAGSLNGDVEAIHDMRVAIRRLRVALNNFAVCLPKEDRKRVRARLEHLADSLGGVRDLDVMIEALKATLQNRSDHEKPAISAMIRRLKNRRRTRLRALVNYLRDEEYANLKREFLSGQDSAETAQQSQETLEIQRRMMGKGHGQAA
jgi:CHAD domain-containing protein